MLKKAAFILIILAMLLAGCAAANQSITPAEAPSPLVERPVAESLAGAPDLAEKSAYAQDQSATSVDRLVIKNASLSIAVDDPQKSMDNISHMAEAMGGFVVSADMYQQTLSNGIKAPKEP